MIPSAVSRRVLALSSEEALWLPVQSISASCSSKKLCQLCFLVLSLKPTCDSSACGWPMALGPGSLGAAIHGGHGTQNLAQGVSEDCGPSFGGDCGALLLF